MHTFWIWAHSQKSSHRFPKDTNKNGRSEWKGQESAERCHYSQCSSGWAGSFGHALCHGNGPQSHPLPAAPQCCNHCLLRACAASLFHSAAGQCCCKQYLGHRGLPDPTLLRHKENSGISVSPNGPSNNFLTQQNLLGGLSL